MDFTGVLLLRGKRGSKERTEREERSKRGETRGERNGEEKGRKRNMRFPKSKFLATPLAALLHTRQSEKREREKREND